jgi:outer membrane protein assembly factor BamB
VISFSQHRATGTFLRLLALACFIGIVASLPLHAQRWVNPHFDAHRLDARDLGYPEANLIPADNSRITALLAHSNGLIYGATSGRTQSYLFLYSRYTNKVKPLGRIADAAGVHHGLVEGRDGAILIATGLNVFDPVQLTAEFPGKERAIEHQLWEDITRPYTGYAGGHIYRYRPRIADTVPGLSLSAQLKRDVDEGEDNRASYTIDDQAAVVDLGIPVPGETIYAVATDPGRTKVYGITYPRAHFFIFDMETRETRDFGEFLTERVYDGPERYWRTVPRALHVDPATGRVYTSGDNGLILGYDPATDTLAPTAMRLPGEYHVGINAYSYPVLENFATTADGRVYAGTSDGFVVQIDFAAKELNVLGKPRVQRRLRALQAGMNGKVYLLAGEFERTVQLYAFAPGSPGDFTDFGPLAVDRSPYYAKRPYQFDSMAVGVDGTIFLGENDRGGKLFIYLPGPGFAGTLNPSNPPTERMKVPPVIPGP